MTRVTFLQHSGFLAETPDAALLFDWWKGTLPELPSVPLVCFASHVHPDHFDPRIFALDDGKRDVTFVLSRDIRLTERNREKWGVSPAAAEKCRFLRGGETMSLPGMTVEALHSTDAGVAFLVTAGGRTIYHAGDLNWWHWEGEDPGWNRNMECNFKRNIEPLRGRHIDVAFAPLDPRQGEAYDRGFRFLLELADIAHLFPMHQWGDFALTEKFRRAYPQWAERVVPVERPGQSWEL